ncbi:MAG: iron-containing alcohol dehydrogenase [Spirochaetia bacterium]|jgi:alcohol dehydrogenase class IV|nr:iron-containing alcohol dehydrogenase [Spirochaetia bacterium]
MIASIASPVHIVSSTELDGEMLADILRYTALKAGRLKVAVILDNAPIKEKDALVEHLKSVFDVQVFSDVQPNPRTADIMRMFSDASFAGSDLVLGIGGGSVLDSAKALAMLSTNGGELDQYLGLNATRSVQCRSLPLVLIPTTAGTGSEVTKVGVYTAESGRKYTLGSPLMHAYTAVLAANLLHGVPASLCAATGLDALDHALESIWNKNSTPLTRQLARRAALKVLTTLPKLYEAIETGAAERTVLQRQMLEASCEAGIAFNLTGTASGHAISFVLSEEWHIPHGLSCAFTLGEVFAWAVQDRNNRTEIATLSRCLHPDLKDEEALVQRLAEDINDLLSKLSIPRTFSELSLNLDSNQIRSLFRRAMEDPKLHNQTPPMQEEDLYRLLEAKL